MYQKIFDSKKITIDEALDIVKPNDEIVSAMASAEPKMFFKHLHERSKRLKNVNVINCLPMEAYPYYMEETYKDSFSMEGWFYSGAIRKAHLHGNISYIPNHLHLAGVKRLDLKRPDVFVGTASPMDKHGYLSLSLSATYEPLMIENAKTVIIEVNPNMPRTFGDTTIHISQIDYVVDVDYQVPEIIISEPNELDMKIGSIIAELVEDGSTLQLGIGGIPNAVTKALMNKKNLGIHTEMLTDGMVDLYNKGVLTGSEKGYFNNKMVATFAMGTKKLYDFIDDNPGVVIKDGFWVNNPYIIGKNKKMVSINTTIEVDLSGQCCSESIGHIQFSGTGGQADTAIGAQNSDGGKSIIALYSTAMVTNRETGKKERISKIVSRLRMGAYVTLSRNDVDYVVTEYGVASLRGTSMKERVIRLIDIAHPDYRDELLEDAKKYHMI